MRRVAAPVRYRIAYGTDTESLEDPGQIVLLDLPSKCADMDNDELTAWINEHWHSTELFWQPLVGWDDLRQALKQILWEVPHMHPSRPNIVINDLAEALGVKEAA